jgi:2-methylcitrate dehydratase
VQVFFKDGTATERVQIDVPLGHRRRRAEGIPVLVKKFEASVMAHFSPLQVERIKTLFADRATLEATPVHEFVSAMIKNN